MLGSLDYLHLEARIIHGQLLSTNPCTLPIAGLRGWESSEVAHFSLDIQLHNVLLGIKDRAMLSE